VVFIHDAAIDDFVATLLLVAMPSVDLKGIVIANADCIPGPGMDAASKLQQFLGRTDIPLALSSARGWNPFPWPYRGDCVTFGEIPSLKPFRSTVPTPPPDGDELLERLLEEAIACATPLTVLLTTGFTPLTDVLSGRPDLIEGVGQVVWMGGAIDVPGNLDPGTVNPVVANKHAEWNVFWDPFAVDFALRNLGRIKVFPLDISDPAKVSEGLLAQLEEQAPSCTFSQLAYEAYSLVTGEPFYRLWDVAAACWLDRPDLYAAPQATPLEVELWGFEQGWLRRSMAKSGPESIQDLYLSFQDLDGFYAYIAAQLARS
jgi:purine nucleosidase